MTMSHNESLHLLLQEASRCEYRKNVVPPDGCGCGVTPSCPDVRPRPCARGAYALPLASSPAVSSCPVAVPIASAERDFTCSQGNSPGVRHRHPNVDGSLRPVAVRFSLFSFSRWGCGFDGVEVALERTLPRGLVLDVAAFATGFRWLMTEATLCSE